MKLTQDEKNYLLNCIRVVENFPKDGILFRDITTLLNNKEAMSFLLNHLEKRYENYKLDYIAGAESRGFIFAAALCAKLGLPFVPIRKPKKLPAPTFSCSYELEYGSDTLEIHQDAFHGKKGVRVLLVDDLIATGGTAIASCELIKKTGGICVEACFLTSLNALGGEKKLQEHCSVYSVLEI